MNRLIFTIIFLLSLSSFAARSGKDVYSISCKACHGEKAEGGMPVVKEGQPVQGPNLTILKKEYLLGQFKVMKDGKRKGKGVEAMLKALKDAKITDEEVKAAIEYASKLPEMKSKHAKIGDAVKGKAKYVVCGTCHGPKGKGYFNPGIPAPRIVGQADFYIAETLKNFKDGHRGMDTPGGFQMRAMANATIGSEEDMKNVAAYIRSLEEEKKSEK